MSLPLKAGIGLLSISSIAGASYLGFSYSQQSTTISDLIDKEYTHILLKTTGEEDKSNWATNWTNYKKESEKHDTDIFGLTGWTKTNSPDLTEKLKEKCSELIKKTSSDTNDSTYQNVTKYCARNVTIKDQATKEKLEIINTKGDDSKWGEIVKNKDNLTAHFTNLKITKPSGGNITATEIKDGCEKALTKNKSEANYSDVFDSYKKVCVKK